jgi:hypothetical protein
MFLPEFSDEEALDIEFPNNLPKAHVSIISRNIAENSVDGEAFAVLDQVHKTKQ